MTRHIILHTWGWGGDGETSGLISNLVSTHHHYQKVLIWYEEIFSSVQHMLMLLISYLPNWYLDKTKQYRVIRPPPRGVNHYIISILITPDLNKDLWISVRLSRYSCFLHQDEEKPNDVQIEFKKQRKKLRFSLFFGTMNKYIELTKSCLD